MIIAIVIMMIVMEIVIVMVMIVMEIVIVMMMIVVATKINKLSILNKIRMFFCGINIFYYSYYFFDYNKKG